MVTDRRSLLDLVTDALEREGSVGVIAPDTRIREVEDDLTADDSGIVDGEPDRATGLRRLYVCLTRAVTSLAVRHDGPLPEELGAP